MKLENFSYYKLSSTHWMECTTLSQFRNYETKVICVCGCPRIYVCVQPVTRSVKSGFVWQWVAGRQTGGQMDSQAFCGQTIIAGPCLRYWVTHFFPPCVCAAGKGRGEVGWARICAGGSKTMRQGHVGAMKGKAGTYEYVAASRREEVLSGGGRPRGKWCEKLRRRVLLSVSTPCSVLTPLFFQTRFLFRFQGEFPEFASSHFQAKNVQTVATDSFSRPWGGLSQIV